MHSPCPVVRFLFVFFVWLIQGLVFIFIFFFNLFFSSRFHWIATNRLSHVSCNSCGTRERYYLCSREIHPASGRKHVHPPIWMPRITLTYGTRLNTRLFVFSYVDDERYFDTHDTLFKFHRSSLKIPAQLFHSHSLPHTKFLAACTKISEKNGPRASQHLGYGRNFKRDHKKLRLSSFLTSKKLTAKRRWALNTETYVSREKK